MKIKKTGQVLFAIFCVTISLMILKNQGVILDAILSLKQDTILLSNENTNDNRVKYGQKIVDFSDLYEGRFRDRKKGGSNLVLEFPKPLEEGLYYCHIQGKSKGEAGQMIFGLHNTEMEQSYNTPIFFSTDVREYNFLVSVGMHCDTLFLEWQNHDNVPIIDDFYLSKLYDGYDINVLPLGVIYSERKVETVTLGDEDIFISGNLADAIYQGNRLVYAIDNVIFVKNNERHLVYPVTSKVLSLCGEQGDRAVAILEDGEIIIISENGLEQQIPANMFSDIPQNAVTSNGYLFVAEGYGKAEIFRICKNGVEYISNLYLDNYNQISKICLYRHNAYVLSNHSVFSFDISNILSPRFIGKVYGDGNITDISIRGDKLCVSIVNECMQDEQGDDCTTGHSIGYVLFQLELAGNVKKLEESFLDSIPDITNIEGTVDIENGCVVQCLGGYEGARIVSMSKVPKETKITIENLLGESFFPTKILGYGENSLVFVQGKGLYFVTLKDHERSLFNKKLKLQVREKKIDKRFTIESNYDAECLLLEVGNIVRDIVLLEKYYVVGLKDGIAVYSKEGQELLFNANLEYKKLCKYQGKLVVLKDDMAYLYEVTDKGLVVYTKLRSCVGELNDVLTTKENYVMLLGMEGAMLLSGEFNTLGIAKGANLLGLATESQNGYVCFDSDTNLWYIRKSGLNNVADIISLVQLVEGNLLSEENDWWWFGWRGYVRVSGNVEETENGYVMIYDPTLVECVDNDEVGWMGLDMRYLNMHDEKELVIVHGIINVAFVMDITDPNAPKRIYKCSFRDRVSDIDLSIDEVAFAAGRDGAVILKRN